MSASSCSQLSPSYRVASPKSSPKFVVLFAKILCLGKKIPKKEKKSNATFDLVKPWPLQLKPVVRMITLTKRLKAAEAAKESTNNNKEDPAVNTNSQSSSNRRISVRDKLLVKEVRTLG